MQEQEIKEKVKERYGRIALTGNSDYCCCCSPEERCVESGSPKQSATAVCYDNKDMDSIPEASVLGVGCGAPTKFAEIREGEIVVDLGSGAGIDVSYQPISLESQVK